MNSKIYEFDPVLYPFKLLVSRDFDTKELGEMFYSIGDDEDLLDAPEEFVPKRRTIARTLQVADKKECETYILVLLCKPRVIGAGTVSHESYHIVNMIGEWLGFMPKKSSEDEPQAYFIQWLSNCIDCVLKGHPERMSGSLLE